MITVDDIIRMAGGVTRISAESLSSARPVRPRSVHCWRHNGIDEAHWDLMMRLVPGLTVQTIYDANRAVKRRHPKRRASPARRAA